MTIERPTIYSKWRFTNAKPRKSLPEEIISKQSKGKDEDEFQETILTLSLIFNDAKNITLLNDTISDLYEIDQNQIVCDNNGELTGIRLYFARLLFGTLHESLNYLNEKRESLESKRFLQLIEGLSQEDKLRWKLLTKIAFKEKVDIDEFKSEFMDETSKIIEMIESIRNNISFHYQTRKRFANGYKKIFFEQEKNDANSFALRSLQKTDFLNTRYYYADAATEGYFIEMFNGKYSIKNFTEKALEISAILCYSINSVLNSFFEKLPNR